MTKQAHNRAPTLNDIESFLREAAPMAWPSGIGPATSPQLPGFWETAVTIGEFSLVDLFGGARTDVGFEVVLHQGRLVWGASYRGGLHDKHIDVDEAYGFLGRALDARASGAIPIRGPVEYSEPQNPWIYRHKLIGDLAGFTSLERMYESGGPFYERITVGGFAGDSATYTQWIQLPDLP